MEKALQDNNLQDADDGWPWPSLLMLAHHILHISEEEFWDITPRKFLALIEAFSEYSGGSSDDTQKVNRKEKPIETTIDKMPSWW